MGNETKKGMELKSIKTFKDYSDAVKGFIPQHLINQKMFILEHAIFGMNSEVGEVAGIIQKTYQGRDLDVTHLAREIGDVLWFLNEAAISMGYDSLEVIAQINYEKLYRRHGGDTFNAYKDAHRKEGDV